MTARRCSSNPCRRTTTDPSGRCHDHRTSAAVAVIGKTMPPPSPVVTERPWEPDLGIPHPTGGYDSVKDDGVAKLYVRHGKFHRTDGPAAEWEDGTKEWWVEGFRHRLDGPAVTWSDGSGDFYVDDVDYTAEEFERLHEALGEGAPPEWARSYAKGDRS